MYYFPGSYPCGIILILPLILNTIAGDFSAFCNEISTQCMDTVVVRSSLLVRSDNLEL